MTWYPASWEPGVNGAGDYTPRGLSVELCGGPLDGRRGHVYNALEALWVARYGSEEFVVASLPSEPQDLPSDALLVGRYVYQPGDRSLHWHRLESPLLRGVAAAAGTPPAVPRQRFLALWPSASRSNIRAALAYLRRVVAGVVREVFPDRGGRERR
jgi:hypothetical protein